MDTKEILEKTKDYTSSEWRSMYGFVGLCATVAIATSKNGKEYQISYWQVKDNTGNMSNVINKINKYLYFDDEVVSVCDTLGNSIVFYEKVEDKIKKYEGYIQSCDRWIETITDTKEYVRFKYRDDYEYVDMRIQDADEQIAEWSNKREKAMEYIKELMCAA